jgi:hypothetical protein
MACREYLVTSPAEECARPTPEGVRVVRLAAHAWSALAAAEAAPGARSTPWVPLPFAPEWVALQAGGEARREGPGLAEAFFGRLAEEVAARERG